MGMVNKVIPHAELEDEAIAWVKEILTKSPTAIKMLKYSFNLIDDGPDNSCGEATRLAYGTDEAREGREAFLDKRDQDFSQFLCS